MRLSSGTVAESSSNDDALLVSSLVLGPSAAASALHGDQVKLEAQRRARTATTVRTATRPAAGASQSPITAIAGFFGALITAVFFWWIGCCIAYVVLFVASGFSPVEETSWGTPVLVVIYVLLAIAVLFSSFSSRR